MGKYYKVVYDKVYGKYLSWAIIHDPGGFTLEYSIGKTTWAPLGTIGVMVFKNLHLAARFDYRAPDKVILEGEAVLAKPQEYIAVICCSDIIKWMNGEKKYEMLAPPGTHVCAGFTPERIMNV